ncbi:MAG: amino acid permease [archaeon]
MERLKRELGFFELTVLGVSVIIGAGIYSLLGEGIAYAGNTIFLSLLLAAIPAYFTCSSYVKLAKRVKVAGGEYIFASRVHKQLGFIVGWLLFLGIIFSSATVALGFSGYLTQFLNIDLFTGAIIALFFALLINLSGLKHSFRFLLISNAITIFGLILVIAYGVPKFGVVNYFETPNGISGVLGAASLLFFAYLGFETIVRFSEDSKNPAKDIPKAMFTAITISMIIYCLVGLSAVSIVNWTELSHSKAPIAKIIEKNLGPTGFFIITLIALFATFSTVLFGILSGSRLILALARKKLLSKDFATIDITTGTPKKAMIACATCVLGALLINEISLLAELTNFVIYLLFIIINSLAISENLKEKKNESKIRNNIPITSFLGLVFSIIFLLNLENKILGAGVALIIIGFITFGNMRQRLS